MKQLAVLISLISWHYVYISLTQFLGNKLKINENTQMILSEKPKFMFKVPI